MSEPNHIHVRCARCECEIQSHNHMMFVSCLAFLSGEIDVYRKINEDNKK